MSLSVASRRLKLFPYVLSTLLVWTLSLFPASFVVALFRPGQILKVSDPGDSTALSTLGCLTAAAAVVVWSLRRLVLDVKRMSRDGDPGPEAYRLVLPVCLMAMSITHIGCLSGYLLTMFTGDPAWGTHIPWQMMRLLLVNWLLCLVAPIVAGRRYPLVWRLAIILAVPGALAWFCGLASALSTIKLVATLQAPSS